MEDSVQPGPVVERGSESWLLAERLKELDCLYGVARVFERDGSPLGDTLQAVVELLPAAFQHPEVAAAELEFQGERYVTGGYRATPWVLSYPVVVGGQSAGRLTVSYAAERPECDHGPFLAEELSLLSVIARRLGSYIEKRRSQEQLLLYQDYLRDLAADLSADEYRERRRIAELLHDRIGQALALLAIRLAHARASTGDVGLCEMLRETEGLVEEIIADTRALTFELCPPVLYELGLVAAVEWLGEQLQKDHGLAIEVLRVGEETPLGDELRTTLFRAVRELLTNVVKHAHARSVLVTVGDGPDGVFVSVQDDGVGAEVGRSGARRDAAGGFGLFSIGERITYLGGSVQMDSRPGGGTTVVLRVPRGG